MASETVGYTNVISYPSNIGLTKDKNDVSATDIGYTLGKADFAQRPMSMRKFLEPFDHKILTDAEAGSKYAAYKTSFARQQLEEFFERNKNSPWFREKYHPETCPSSDTKQNVFKYRLSLFMELCEGHKLDNLVLSGGHEADLVRLLDAIGIRLLGGTDEDVAYYDDYERCLELIAQKAVKRLGNSAGGAVTGAQVTATEKLAVDITDASCADATLAKAGGPTSAAHAEESQRRQVSADCDGVSTATVEKKKRKKKRMLAVQSARAAERRRPRGDQNKRNVQKRRTIEQPTDDVRADPGSEHQGDAVDCGARSSSASSDSNGDSDDDSGSSSSSSGSSSAESDSSAAEAGSTSGEDGSSGSSSSSSSSDTDGSESGSSGSSATRRRPRGHRPSSRSSRDVSQQDGQQSPADAQLTGPCSPVQSSPGHDGDGEEECGLQGGESDAEMIILDEKGASPPVDDGQEQKDEIDEGHQDMGQHPEENRDEFRGKAASSITCGADDCGVEMTASSGYVLPTRRPLHHSTVLFLPHIPFSVYKKDLNALFSTSPHFLRLAVLDPFLMPSSGGETGVATDPLLPEFGSSTTRRPSSTTRSPDQRGLPVLRRVGWATFASQQLQQPDDGQQQHWVDVDVEAIRSRLVQQAMEAEAPGELLDCLRSAMVIVDHPLRNSAHTRIRTNNRLMSRLMEVCPLRMNSKSLLRRHLVLAARLVYDLDRYRGLWQEEEKASASQASADTASPCVDNDMVGESVASSEAAEHTRKAEPEVNQIEPPAKAVELGNSPDSLDGAESPQAAQKKSATEDDGAEDERSTAERADGDPMPIDPGEDLLMAANILSSLASRNPLLHGLTDYLVDEGSAEEELLLAGGFQAISFFPGRPGAEARSAGGGVGSGTLPALYTEPACDSSELVQALDRLIFYLRVVHSVDFYAPAIYSDEEAMPHPCRLMHVRPGQAEVDRAVAVARQQQRQPLPSNSDHRAAEAGGQPATSTGGGSNSRYEQVFSSQLNRLLRLCRPLAEPDCRLLGLRNVDDVVEAFIQANTKRKKRKTDVIWVCPLSDKKFRDPIYVRKHIMNKHLEKVEATKKENAFFFNNYLLDAARPQLPLEPQAPKTRRRRLRECRRKTSPSTGARRGGADAAVSEDDRGWRLPAGDRGGLATTMRMGPGAGWPQKLSLNPACHWPSQSGLVEYLDRRPPLPFPGYRQQQRFPPRFPFYPHQQQHQHSGMGMRFPRLPFNQMRGNRFMGAIRRGFNTRPYVDLDAP